MWTFQKNHDFIILGTYFAYFILKAHYVNWYVETKLVHRETDFANKETKLNMNCLRVHIFRQSVQYLKIGCFSNSFRHNSPILQCHVAPLQHLSLICELDLYYACLYKSLHVCICACVHKWF